MGADTLEVDIKDVAFEIKELWKALHALYRDTGDEIVFPMLPEGDKYD